MSGQSVGVLLRKMVELEQQGAEQFFGEPEFDVNDLLVTDVRRARAWSPASSWATCRTSPLLFSTFMMWLLAELYHNLPEAGDLPEAEARLLLRRGAPALRRRARRRSSTRSQQVVRLIRSKGVGVFFVTQTPKDVPGDVLAQLGNRVQHALRAHTPDDDKALRATVRTFPKTEFYDLEETLTSLGIGEAVVTVLDARGAPTPVVATRLIPPGSRMAPLTPDELQADIRQSDLLAEYGHAVDRESAREMLAARMARTQAPAPAGAGSRLPAAGTTREGAGARPAR